MIPRTKVFVGSLPPGSKPEELRRLFESYGVVTECDIMNRCGFVHMETQEMAENAIRALNNTNFKGATISVEHGRMKDRGGPRSGAGGGSGSGRGASRGRLSGSDDRRGSGGSGSGGNAGMRRGTGGGGGSGTRGQNVRVGFGNQNQGGGGMRGGRRVGASGVSGNIAGGPIRRDRSFHPRNIPYIKSGGGPLGTGGVTLFDNGGSGGPKGGNRNFEDGGFNNMPQGGIGGLGNMGPNDRFSSGNYGMGNQDRRGFALPDNRNMYGNGIVGQKRGPGIGGGGGGSALGMGSGFGGNNQAFDRRQGGNFSGSRGRDNFGRRGGPGGGANINSESMGFRGGYSRVGSNMAGGSGGGGGNYNQQFPSLGAGSGNR